MNQSAQIQIDEEPSFRVAETALLSEKTLAEDRLQPEEDEAWDWL